MKINDSLFFLFFVQLSLVCAQIPDNDGKQLLKDSSLNIPKPIEPLPNLSQLKWQELEFYGFIHFSLNTFTGDEWGYGDKSPALFNPSEMDVRQWARVAKEAGMKGLILTNKHHDGFCLWPSKYTEYSVKNSPWKNGKGDVVKELAEACKEYGLKMGIYLSPWDRNSTVYGTPEYLIYFRNQLTELLTNYGEIFEVWFDGANGGDGHYGGANEVRMVDKKSYYDWENTNALVHKLQPNSIIWSDAGPDARWVGNEHGFSYETTWSPLLKDSVYGGMPNYNTKYAMGQENGTHWVPAEADVSIRPGWYYHEAEDTKVKTLEQLLDIYYKSVGQNSTLLLNLPVDQRGLVHENDVKQLRKLTNQLKADFAENLAINRVITASNIRDGSDFYKVENTIDGNKESYWATDDEVVHASFTINFEEPTEFNRFLVQEYITLGQRVKRFTLEAEVDGEWFLISQSTTIGYKRIVRFDNITATKLRFRVLEAKGSPLISAIGVYNAPDIVESPAISRSKNGIITIKAAQKGVDIFYTVNNNALMQKGTRYLYQFSMKSPGTITAFAMDRVTKRKSDEIHVNFDIPKTDWTIKYERENSLVQKAIDDNIFTNWEVTQANLYKHKIDLGKRERIKGFTYTPDQTQPVSGAITHYSFYGSLNGNDWELLSKGEFPNISSNPIEQNILFPSETDVRYLKLKANTIMNNGDIAIIAEIGVITK